MPPRLHPKLLLLLTLPPLLWAGNAVLGQRLVAQLPPLTLNALRWSLAFALLLPMTERLWRERAQLVRHWRWFALTGLLGMGSYNALLYQSLRSSSPLNVTLIAASLPLAMLLVGALVFRVRPRALQGLGALLALAGVLVVLSQGSLARLLALQFVQGDLLMVVATLAWALYSWLLTHRASAIAAGWNWADLLAAQTGFGLLFAWPAAALEWTWGSAAAPQWEPSLLLGLAYIAVGPSLIAYRCWGLAVAQAGPVLTGVFFNLTPLFAALLTLLTVHSPPQGFHATAFALIAAGILVSSRR